MLDFRDPITKVMAIILVILCIAVVVREIISLLLAEVIRLREHEDRLHAIIDALDTHDAEWAHRHISKRPNVPEKLRKAIDDARGSK